jgi:molybdopterin synthase catalytic subunit
MLEYEAQEPLALKMLERLRTQAMERFGLLHAAVYHRLGTVEIGAASVVIAVSAAHRGAAFDGCRFLIDALKTSVPIWKKEYYADGPAPEWVGPDGNVVQI